MSPSCRQSTVFPSPGLKWELNSDPFWIDGATCSALCDETLNLFEGAPTPLEGSVAPSFDDHHVGYPSTSTDTERFNDVDLTSVASDVPFGIHLDDLYVSLSLIPPRRPSRVTELHPPSCSFGHGHQATDIELFWNGNEACTPAQTVVTYELPPYPPTLCDDSVASITQILSTTHLLPLARCWRRIGLQGQHHLRSFL